MFWFSVAFFCGAILTLEASVVNAAIAYDNSAIVASGNNPSWNMTETGTDIMDVVCTGGNTPSNVDDTGTPMVQIGGSAAPAGGGFYSAWFLPHQTAGTHTYTITGTSVEASSASYTGVDVVGANVVGNVALNQNYTLTLTTGATSWVVNCQTTNDSAASSNYTIRQFSNASAFGYEDSNGIYPSGGNFTVSGNSALDNWKGVMVELTPSAGGGGGGTTTVATSTPYAPTEQEILFVFGIFLFIFSVPFWARVFNFSP